MDAALIKNHNAVVKPSDTVYMLGDVSFHKSSVGVPLLRRLLGKKILILGNHDKYSAAQYEAAGFVVQATQMVVRLFGYSIKMSHYPYWPGPKEEDPNELRFEDRRPKCTGGWLLCGHVHEKWKTKGMMVNVGVDQWGYKPVSLSEIERLIVKSGRGRQTQHSEEGESHSPVSEP
jgi:calcineurin-like phosphoesterase family protein